MTRFKSHQLVVLGVLVLAFAAWTGGEFNLPVVQAQTADRVLEIERYPDEPLQIVKLRIGTQSVKDRVKQKFIDNQSKWAIDSVQFNEEDDWVKRVSITFRNASDKPVYGLQGQLTFKPLGYPMMFAVPLTAARQLHDDPLEPEAEIELSVNPAQLNRILEAAKGQNADLRGAAVSLSLDTVSFSDKLRWYRGKLVRPDDTTPNKWVPVQSAP
jgi:hypothetical protein